MLYLVILSTLVNLCRQVHGLTISIVFAVVSILVVLCALNRVQQAFEIGCVHQFTNQLKNCCAGVDLRVA